MDRRSALLATHAPGPSILVRLLVGIVEIVCGALLIVGLLTRLATTALIVIMIVAIVSTKVPILPKLPRYGFWSMLHEARADFDMLLGLLYLLIEGGGAWSLDARLAGWRPAAGG
jgi:putative oxidoreductase